MQGAGVVVGERDDVGDGKAAAEPGVGVEELLHPAGVSGHDDHEAVTVVLHALEQRLDRLVTEAFPLVAQPVRLVDEEHAVQGPVDDRRRPLRGLPHEPGDQVARSGLHAVAPGQHAHVPVHLAEEAGHGGLAGPRVAGEHEVP